MNLLEFHGPLDQEALSQNMFQEINKIHNMNDCKLGDSVVVLLYHFPQFSHNLNMEVCGLFSQLDCEWLKSDHPHF